jgi:hypothetical protein
MARFYTAPQHNANTGQINDQFASFTTQFRRHRTQEHVSIGLLTVQHCHYSSAEVERVFSQVKLIKTSHRSSIKIKTLNHLLNIKLNCDKTMFEHVLQPSHQLLPDKKQD